MSRSNQNFVKRQVKIINYLKVKPLNYNEILFKLQNSIEEFSGYSLRTFQRDLKTIESVFSIEIKFNRSINKYEIVKEDHDVSNNRMFESIELADVLSNENRKAILLDSRKTQTGSERFEEVLEAISGNYKIKMNYKKYGEEKEKFRFVYPLAIKESRSRWYLIAVDENDDEIKSFAFDRITALGITADVFKIEPIEIASYFNDFIGVDRKQLSSETQVVLETADENQVYYLESLPLHSSQRIKKINKNKFHVFLNVHITYDFVLELLYLSSSVRVVEPLFLVERMNEQLQKAIALYKPSKT